MAKKEVRKQTCANCRFYCKRKPDIDFCPGECRRNPPDSKLVTAEASTSDGSYMYQTEGCYFPGTYPKMWCGEWQAIERRRN